MARTTIEHKSERLQCSPRKTHASLTHDRRYLRIRCTDSGCPDAVAAKEMGKICIHVWDLHHRDLRWWSEFETK